MAMVTEGMMGSYDTSRGLGWDAKAGAACGFVCRRASALAAWDGVHFTNIAVNGYEFEHQHAFYPGLPFVIQLSSRFVRFVMRKILLRNVPETCLANLAAILFNTITFALSATALHSLSKTMLKNDGVAEAAARLYIINPANIFYGSAYTESGFAWAQFAAGSVLEENTIVFAGILFGVATAFRSNGVLNVIIVLSHISREVFLTLRNRQDQRRHFKAARWIKRGFIALILVVFPHYLFARFGEARYCPFSIKVKRPWCQNRSWRNLFGLIPSPMYSYLQRHYWGLGFMSSYHVRNLGNVILGAPAIAIGAYLSQWFLRERARRSAAFVKEDHQFFVSAYYLQLAVMTLIAATYMHVQVATRFLSTSPAMYWGLAHLGAKSPTLRLVVTTYSLAYAFVGVALFASFYPWT